MGVQDQIHTVPVIEEAQEDEWMCQEIFNKVKLHVEGKFQMFIHFLNNPR